MKTYQFKLKPTKQQARLIDRMIEQHRLLYNHCLELKIKQYKEFGLSLSTFDLIKSEVSKFKNNVNVSSLQQTVRRLGKAYDKFFKSGGFPRFKAKDRFRTTEFTYSDGCKFKNNNKLYLQFIGEIICCQHREIVGRIRSLSVTTKPNGYFVNICVDQEQVVKSSSQHNAVVGIDFGIKNTITTSDGLQVQTPKHTKSQSKTVARLHRCKNYKALQKVYTKISNQRKDFNHKLSRKLVDKYDILCLEDLKSSEIITNIKNINSRIYDVAITQLKQFIKYKAENAGKLCVLVNPAFTTQTCSNCGTVKQKGIQERRHNCPCGASEDRDVNAAKNILKQGLMKIQL